MARSESISTIGFLPSGAATFASRVQGKFSIQEAWEATGSISFTLAQVFGAFHQLWNFTRASGWSRHPLRREGWAGALPPWPLTMTMRRKPVRGEAVQDVADHPDEGVDL